MINSTMIIRAFHQEMNIEKGGIHMSSDYGPESHVQIFQSEVTAWVLSGCLILCGEMPICFLPAITVSSEAASL